MLEQLSITGFAVARSVTIQPGPGLNVFTGETGAGKSLVVDALAFLFGARRGRDVIAAGADKALVEATFRTPAGPLVLERAIGLSGRSSARINGQPATVEALQSHAATLIEIHGQSEQLAILRPATQLAVLDAYAGLTPRVHAFAATVRQLREVRRTITTLSTDARERERQVEQLRFELEEIEAAALQPGEDEALRAEHLRLSSTARRSQDVEVALQALDAAPIPQAVSAVSDLAAQDPEAADLADSATLLENTASDLARLLRRYRDAIEDDPARLSAIAERLDTIARLRRKYGDTVEAILAYASEAATRLTTLTGAETNIEALRQREDALITTLAADAAGISAVRRKSAADLVAAVSEEVARLGMAQAVLSVGFSAEDAENGLPVAVFDYDIVVPALAPPHGEPELIPRAFSETGIDRIEFLASFNPGEAPRPLATVASGGETSRFLLALTTVLGNAAEPRLVVLDEADEGVGGRAGGLVGSALQRLAARHQVLCITHLPQVAAYGSQHYVVTKHTDGARTWSEVAPVTASARLDELASMLGALTDANRTAAADLLAAATPT